MFSIGVWKVRHAYCMHHCIIIHIIPQAKARQGGFCGCFFGRLKAFCWTGATAVLFTAMEHLPHSLVWPTPSEPKPFATRMSDG